MPKTLQQEAIKKLCDQAESVVFSNISKKKIDPVIIQENFQAGIELLRQAATTLREEPANVSDEELQSTINTLATLTPEGAEGVGCVDSVSKALIEIAANPLSVVEQVRQIKGVVRSQMMFQLQHEHEALNAEFGKDAPDLNNIMTMMGAIIVKQEYFAHGTNTLYKDERSFKFIKSYNAQRDINSLRDEAFAARFENIKQLLEFAKQEKNPAIQKEILGEVNNILRDLSDRSCIGLNQKKYGGTTLDNLGNALDDGYLNAENIMPTHVLEQYNTLDISINATKQSIQFAAFERQQAALKDQGFFSREKKDIEYHADKINKSLPKPNKFLNLEDKERLVGKLGDPKKEGKLEKQVATLQKFVDVIIDPVEKAKYLAAIEKITAQIAVLQGREANDPNLVPMILKLNGIVSDIGMSFKEPEPIMRDRIIKIATDQLAKPLFGRAASAPVLSVAEEFEPVLTRTRSGLLNHDPVFLESLVEMAKHPDHDELSPSASVDTAMMQAKTMAAFEAAGIDINAVSSAGPVVDPSVAAARAQDSVAKNFARPLKLIEEAETLLSNPVQALSRVKKSLEMQALMIAGSSLEPAESKKYLGKIENNLKKLIEIKNPTAKLVKEFFGELRSVNAEVTPKLIEALNTSCKQEIQIAQRARGMDEAMRDGGFA